MNNLHTVELKWDMLGALLATLSDEDQAKFFHGFAVELSKYESQYKREVQMFYVADHLSPQDKKVLEESLSCFWYQDKKEIRHD